MICIGIPRELIPLSCMHTFDEAVYSKGCFIRMRENTFVALTDELTLDCAHEEDTFFIEMSGNEFVKLLERDTIPSWITREQLIQYSNGNGYINDQGKMIWVRPKEIKNESSSLAVVIIPSLKLCY